MFKYAQKGSVKYIESSALVECDFIVHAFCTRFGGVSEGEFASLNFAFRDGERKENIFKNWDVLSASFGISKGHFLALHQVHRNDIIVIDDVRDINRADLDCDGVITTAPGLAICIKTADCVPILMVDKKKHIVGAVHAGWKGAALQIAVKAVEMFVEKYNSSPSDIIAVIGPSIGSCCYQVDSVVFSSMQRKFRCDDFLKKCKQKNKWMLDLAAVNMAQLREMGVPPGNIFSSGICTSCNKALFFSHRGSDGKTGRQVNFIMLKRR